jgi:hypothetical protein
VLAERARELVLALIAGTAGDFLDAVARLEQEIFGVLDSQPEHHVTR